MSIWKSELGRHGHGTHGDMRNPVQLEIGYSVPTKGGPRGSNLCRTGGLHAHGETHASVSAETSDTRYSLGQPDEIDGQLKPVNAARRGRYSESKSQSFALSADGSKLEVLQ